MKEEKNPRAHPYSAEAIQRHRDKDFETWGVAKHIVEYELNLGLKLGKVSGEVVDAMNVYYGLSGQEPHTHKEVAAILKTNASHIRDLHNTGWRFVLDERRRKAMISGTNE